VRPIDVARSSWRTTLERLDGTAVDTMPASDRRRRVAVRLGLRFVRGLREEAAHRIEAERARRPFDGAADLARRSGLLERELAALAELGALASITGLDRRAALWQVRGLPLAREPLLAGIEAPATSPPAREMSAIERTLADYRASGMTTGPHLMAHLRPTLRREGIVPLSSLQQARAGSRIRTAGLVIVRQRPGTAKGICFLTLEDETGTGNAIVMPDRFAEFRVALHTAPLLVLDGEVQRHDGVVHLKVAKVRGFSPGPTPASHDFH
jgi:error-prone DNA polymerase